MGFSATSFAVQPFAPPMGFQAQPTYPPPVNNAFMGSSLPMNSGINPFSTSPNPVNNFNPFTGAQGAFPMTGTAFPMPGADPNAALVDNAVDGFLSGENDAPLAGLVPYMMDSPDLQAALADQNDPTLRLLTGQGTAEDYEKLDQLSPELQQLMLKNGLRRFLGGLQQQQNLFPQQQGPQAQMMQMLQNIQQSLQNQQQQKPAAAAAKPAVAKITPYEANGNNQIKTFTGKDGVDTLKQTGNYNQLTATLGNGNDIFSTTGKYNTNKIDAGAGADKLTLAGSFNTNRITAGAGADFISIHGKNNTNIIFAGADNDAVNIYGSGHALAVKLEEGNDTSKIFGNNLTGWIDGGKGDDNITILGSAENNHLTILGGEGTDTVVIKGNEADWKKTDSEDGKYTIYTNEKTNSEYKIGDSVETVKFEAATAADTAEATSNADASSVDTASPDAAPADTGASAGGGDAGGGGE